MPKMPQIYARMDSVIFIVDLLVLGRWVQTGFWIHYHQVYDSNHVVMDIFNLNFCCTGYENSYRDGFVVR